MIILQVFVITSFSRSRKSGHDFNLLFNTKNEILYWLLNLFSFFALRNSYFLFFRQFGAAV